MNYSKRDIREHGGRRPLAVVGLVLASVMILVSAVAVSARAETLDSGAAFETSPAITDPDADPGDDRPNDDSETSAAAISESDEPDEGDSQASGEPGDEGSDASDGGSDSSEPPVSRPPEAAPAGDGDRSGSDETAQPEEQAVPGSPGSIVSGEVPDSDDVAEQSSDGDDQVDGQSEAEGDEPAGQTAASEIVTGEIAATSFSVTIVSDPAGEVSPGGVLAYTIAISRLADDDGDDGQGNGSLLVYADLSRYVTVVESSISDGGEPLNYPEGEAGRIGWRLGTLKPGESRTVSFSAILDEGLAGGIEVTTSATIATASVPSASASVTNLVRAPSHVQVTVDTLRSTVTPGELALFRVTVRVIGSAAASGVAVSQTLPDSLEFAHATSGGSHAAGTTSWALGTLPGNSQTEMLVGALLVAGPAGGTEVETTVDATADDPVVPPDVANPHDAEVVVTASANLVVTKTPSVAVAGIGDEITYTVQVTNTGDGAASDVAVVDELPGALAFVSADSGGQFAGGTVAWQLASLGPGETKLLHVRAKVVQAGDISNGVTASGTNVSGAGSSSSTTAVTASATSAVVSSASLPFTGVNALEFVAIALAAIAAGLGLVALSMSHSSNMRNHFD